MEWEGARSVIIAYMTDDSPRRVPQRRLGAVVPDSDGGAKYVADCTRRRVALFLDVDGTLLDLARRPDEVVVPVREIVPTVAHKGDAVAAFLAEPAFAGRMPVFV